MNTVARNIKRLRTDRHLTQDELAEKVHVTRQTVSNWETGKNQPDIDTLDTLASVFGTDLNELIYGNRKNEYPRYQKRFIKSVIIALSIIVVMIGLRLAFIPYLRQLVARTFDYVLETQLFSYVSKVIIYFFIGFCVLSVFSLWFDCSVRKARPYFAAAVACIVPVLIFPCEYLCWKLISSQTPLYFFGVMIRYQWLISIVTQVLPAAAGVLVFLHHNPKENTTESDTAI